MAVLCQTCGALNDEQHELCARCQSKLMVLSGSPSEPAENEDEGQDGFSLDEHLLERISVLEEVVKRATETLKTMLENQQQQEKNIFVNQTGLMSLKEVLEKKEIFHADELSELWEEKMDQQMVAFEQKERFLERRDRIVSLYRGEKKSQFMRRIGEAGSNIVAFDIARGLKILEEAYRLDRANYELAFYLGETYFNEGELSHARPYLSAVLDIRPEHFDARVYYGVLLNDVGDQAGAEKHLKKAIAISQESFLPYFSLGAIYAVAGKLNLAQRYLRMTLERNQFPQAYFMLGTVLYEKGSLAGAITNLQKALKLDPDYEEALYQLGLCYLDRNRGKKALECFQEALEINPNKMEYQEAVKLIGGGVQDRLPAVTGDAAALVGDAESQIGAKRYRKAAETYQRALELAPEDPTINISYALLCLSLNRNREAIHATRKVLKQKPAEMVAAAAYTTLLESLRAEGKFREGNRLMEEMLQRYDSNYSKSIAYYEMAYNLAEMEENLDGALEYARMSLKFSPKELKQFPYAALGWVHYKRREYDEAIVNLSRSMELGPTVTNLMHLGMALLASGEAEKAKVVFKRARSYKNRGFALEDKIFEQIKNNMRLVERVRRRRGTPVRG